MPIFYTLYIYLENNFLIKLTFKYFFINKNRINIKIILINIKKIIKKNKQLKEYKNINIKYKNIIFKLNHKKKIKNAGCLCLIIIL